MFKPSVSKLILQIFLIYRRLILFTIICEANCKSNYLSLPYPLKSLLIVISVSALNKTIFEISYSCKNKTYLIIQSSLMSVCLSVRPSLKISVTTEPIGFYSSGYIPIGPVVVLRYILSGWEARGEAASFIWNSTIFHWYRKILLLVQGKFITICGEGTYTSQEKSPMEKIDKTQILSKMTWRLKNEGDERKSGKENH